jgi:hypothetical protein
MKKFSVSLALNVPCNFEVEVSADSKEQALKKALAKWNDDDNSENISEPIWEDASLDIDTAGAIDGLGNGIDIQEL